MKKIYSIPLLSLLLFLLYSVRLYQIDGTSMNYGLIEGDYVISYRLFDTIERGDMLVIKHPLDREGRLYIKRCVALPKDKFFQKNRAFYLQIEGDSNHTKEIATAHDLEVVQTKEGYFIKNPYVKYYGVVHNWKLTVPRVLTRLPLTTVSKNHYYMLGDYRDNSADSRFFGAVPKEWVCSKAIYLIKKPRSWESLISIKEVEEE